MTRPPHALGDTTVRVLFAVMNGQRTFPRLIRALSLNRSTIHHHLTLLRKAGLVDWTDGARGSLHATARAIPIRQGGPKWN